MATRFTRSALALAVSSALVTLAACGGGGSSSTSDSTDDSPGATADFTYSGTVLSPNDSIARNDGSWPARLASALLPAPVSAAITGLTPIAGAQIDVVNLETGETVAENVAQTDSEGRFSFESDLAGASNLALVVRGTSELRAPLNGTTADINPVTEAVVRSVVDAVDNGGRNYSDFTPAELGSIISYAIAQDVTFTEDTAIDLAIDEFLARVPELQDMVTDASTSDASAPPSGAYTVVAANTDNASRGFEEGLIRLGIDSPDLRFIDDGTLGIDEDGSEGEVFLGTADALLRASVNSNVLDGSGSTEWSVSGSRLFVAAGDDTQLGGISGDREVFAIALQSLSRETLDDGSEIFFNNRGLGIGFKQAGATPNLDGDYHLIGYENRFEVFPGSTDSESDFIELRIAAFSGSATVSGSTFEITSSVNDELIAGTPGGGSTLSGGEVAGEPGGATINVATDGSVAIPDANAIGHASSDGRLFALALTDDGSDENFDPPTTAISRQLGLFLRKSSGCDLSSVAGTYNVSGFGGFLEAAPEPAAEGLLFAPNVSKAVITIDGSGNLAADPFTDTRPEMYIDGRTVDIDPPVSDNGSATGTVTVNGDCSVTVSIPNGPTIEGAVTDVGNGRVLALTLETGTNGSARGSRDLLVGIAR